jgi:hypothetical protein
MDFGSMVSGKGESMGDRFSKDEYEGTLLALVNPEAKDIETRHGETTAAFCDYIVVLEGEDKDTVFRGAALFGAVLVPEVTNAAGAIVAGRIGKGTAKNGQSQPWIWEDPSDDERDEVIKWFKANAEDDGEGQILLPESA